MPAHPDDLDAWFAKADDVLRTWHDSPDAMTAGSPDDLDPELPYIPDGREIGFPLRRRPRTDLDGRMRRLLRVPIKIASRLPILRSPRTNRST